MLALVVWLLIVLPRLFRNRQKAPSAAALFELVGGDVFKIKSRVEHLMRYMQSPALPEHLFKSDKKEGESKPAVGADGGAGGAVPGESKQRTMTAEEAPDLSVEGVPPLLVVTFQIPTFSPANPLWGQASEDSDGVCGVVYFVMTSEGREQIAAQKTPAAKLLKVCCFPVVVLLISVAAVLRGR